MADIYKHKYTGQETPYPPADMNEWVKINKPRDMFDNPPTTTIFQQLRNDPRFANTSVRTRLGVVLFLIALVVAGMVLQTIHEHSEQEAARKAAAAHLNACADFWAGREQYAAAGNKMAAVQSPDMRQCPQAKPNLLGPINGGR